MKPSINNLYTSDQLEFEGPFLINQNIFNDDRGYFLESWSENKFNNLLDSPVHFVQDNISYSVHGVLRGLHYQLEPFAQGKLIRCISGSIFDVGVDLRLKSITFGKWFGIELNSSSMKQVWIPPGFAHGFLTLSKSAKIHYKVTKYWEKNSERTLLWSDSELNINWPLNNCKISPLLSPKDSLGNCFKDMLKAGNFFHEDSINW